MSAHMRCGRGSFRTVVGLACALLAVAGSAEPVDGQGARQAAERILGRPISDAELLQGFRDSGLTITELKGELEALGYDPAEADAYAAVVDGAGDALPAGTDAMPLVQILARFDRAAKRRGEVPAPRAEIEPVARPAIFGRSLFQRSTSQFEPVRAGPVPADYRIGPGDELIVVLTGAVEQAYALEVSPEGWVVLPDVGRVVVNGLTLGDVRETLVNRLADVYSGLDRGPGATTFADVSLGTLRTNQIYVIGEVERPAAYQVSSLATVLTALYWAGGPSENGSFREVVVNRGSERIATIDLYDYLLGGRTDGDVRLEHGDVVHVPTVERRIEIDGAVMRPGLYELREDETLADAIRFAGGVEPSADIGRVQIQRILPRADRTPGSDRATLDVSLANIDEARQVKLDRGDRITVFAVLEDPRNWVSISGGVWRPGTYAVESDTRLWDIIERAGGLLPDAYEGRAQIQRLLQSDQTRRMLAVTLQRSPAGLPNANPRIEGMDQILVYARRDLRDQRLVSIAGWVRRPGVFPFADGVTVRDLILKAGGLRTGAYLERAEVSRIVISGPRSDTLTRRFEVPLDSSFVFGIDDGGTDEGRDDDGPDLGIFSTASRAATPVGFKLQNLDAVYIRKAPGFEARWQVVVTGEVALPGPYSLVMRGERLTDLIARAGGVTREAQSKAVQLWRAEPVDADSVAMAEIAGGALGEAELDSLGIDGRLIVTRPRIRRTRVGVDYPSALRNPLGIDNVRLMPNDSIYVPSFVPTVEVRGAVGVETRVLYRKGAGLGFYIDQAGGYTSDADKRRTRVRYANGDVRTRGKKVLVFGGGVPDPDPGSLITVPTRDISPSRGGGFKEWLVVLSTLATAAATVVVISR